MVRLERYGVVLRQICEEDIEQVRVWRNRPDVANFMDFRDEITPQMQREWYRGVTLRGDLFFMIQDEGNAVGVINLKCIDLQSGQAEAGIFMAGEDNCNSIVPFRASLCCFDFSFEVLRLQLINAHILDSNKRAIRYNKMLGFEPTAELVNGRNRKYFLNRERYLNEFRPRLSKLTNPHEKV